MIMSPGRGGSLSPTYFLTVGPTIGGSSSGGGRSVDDIRLPLGGLERQQKRPELQGQPPPPQQQQQHEEGEEIAIPKKGKPSPASPTTFTNARKAGEREERVRKEERGGSTSSPSPKKAGARKSLPIGGVGAGHLSPLASRRSMSDRSASKRGR